MTALNEDIAEKEIQISHIQFKKKMSDTQKHDQIRKLRTTVVDEKTTSVKTITSIANMMIGSSVILYPVLFIQDGLISSLMMMLVVGLVQYWTCAILCLHSKPSQMDVNDTIMRILGPKWYKANLTTNVLLLYIVCVVYFLLIGANFYDLTSSLFVWLNPDYTPPPANKVQFNVYSSQWAGILVMLIIYPLLFVKKIEKLLGFLKLTAYGVMAYMGFVGAMALKNMILGDIAWGDYILFSSNFSNVAGAFALSFIVHPVISPILKKNMDQEKNGRDLFLGYVATATIYAFVGIFGAFACGKDIKNAINYNYSTIFECFPRTEEMGTYIVSKFIQVCILVQNMSALPILAFLTRKQFLQIFSKNHPSARLSLLFTISLIIVSLLVQVLSLNVAAVVSFDGAVIGFVLAYLIPVYMHLKCLYHVYTPQENDVRRSLLEQNVEQRSENLVMAVSLIDDEELQCVPHPPHNKTKDKILYTIIMTFGVAMGIFKIISFVTG